MNMQISVSYSGAFLGKGEVWAEKEAPFLLEIYSVWKETVGTLKGSHLPMHPKFVLQKSHQECHS